MTSDDWGDVLSKVVVDSLKEVVGRYWFRPEHKSIAPTGVAADSETAGQLRRRPILSAPALTDLIGKESNRVLERLSGEVTDPDEYRNDYGPLRDRWHGLIQPVLREMGVAEVVRRTGKSRSAVGRALREGNPTRPHDSTIGKYLAAAAAWVDERADEATRHVYLRPRALGLLYRHLRGSLGADSSWSPIH